MLLTLFADTHFSEPSTFASVNKDGLNSRFVDQLSVFPLIPKETDILVHLGDLLNSKFRVGRHLLDLVFSEFDKAPGTNKILLAGNHDFYDFHREPTLQPFTKICDLVVNKYMAIYNIDWGIIFHCIPYPPMLGYFLDSVEQAAKNAQKNPDVPNILLAHIGIKEADIGPTNLRLPGDVYLHELEYDKFDYVFLGHYHTHQQLADNVWYIGSPLQLNFAERHDKKGIMTLDTGTGEINFIENTIAPRFKVININSQKQLAKLKLNDKDFYKLVLDCEVRHSLITEVTEGKKAIIEGGVKTKREARLKSSNSPKEIMKEYIELTNPDKKLDREKLIGMGEEYLL